jgi:Ca2+:H+ antiporter
MIPTSLEGAVLMARWLYFLIPLGVVALVLRALGVRPELVFLTSALGIIPLAGLIGVATEDLAHKIGPKWGGLLTATMGNAGELIIGVMALREGLLSLVKASLTGSIIGNLLLVLGMGLLVGGLRHGRLQFNPKEAGHHSSMMLLALAGLLLPALFAIPVADPILREDISIGIAVILLLVYVAYLIFSTRPEGQFAVGEEVEEVIHADGRAPWQPRVALGVLVGATVGTGVLAEVLVGTVEQVAHTLGLSEFFVGIIVVPLVGNVAEHLSAVTLAGKGKIDIAVAIAAGSSTQIALFAAPVLVFAGLLAGHPMDLVFHPIEVAMVAMSAGLFAFVSLDGETDWFESLQLLALYAMAAVVFFFLPMAGSAH